MQKNGILIVHHQNLYEKFLTETLMAKNKEFRQDIHYFSEQLKLKLSRMLKYRTTFIEASSGAGKTTAVHDFFSKCVNRSEIIWFIASEEPVTYCWARFCGQLSKIDPVAGERLRLTGFPSEFNQGAVAQTISDLLCGEETYLICDNFQFLREAIPDSVWNAIINHGGASLHVVILTQPIKNRGLAVLGNNDVLRFSNEDFILTKADMFEYYRMAGVKLSDEEAERLYRHSEGWILPMYLQLEGFIRHGSFEQKLSIHELVNETFWKRLSREDKEALLRLSPFDNFTVRQACFLLETSELPENLSQKLEHGLLIRYDIENRRYFMHAILLEFLRLALLDEPEALQRKVIYRAGEWSASQEQKIQALHFFYKLRLFPEMFNLNLIRSDLLNMTLETGRTGMLKILNDMADNSTNELRLKHALTMISIAYEFFRLGEFLRYKGICSEMKQLLESAEMCERERRNLLGELYIVISFGAYNDIAEMGKSHKLAYELMDVQSSLFQQNAAWTFGWPSVLGMFHRESGSLDSELEQMDLCIPCYSALTGGNGSGADVLFRAEALFNRGFYNRAEKLALKGLAAAERYGQESLWLCANFLLRRIYLLKGNVTSYVSCSNAALEFVNHSSYGLCQMTNDMSEGFLAAVTDDINAVPSWLKNGGLDEKRVLPLTRPFAHIVYGRLLLLQRNEPELILRGEVFLSTAKACRSLLAELYITIYLAVLSNRMGENSESLEYLHHALDIALPDGLLIPFAENCDLFSSAICDVLSDRLGNENIRFEQLSKRISVGKSALQRYRFSIGTPPGVTAREYEVARMASEGKRNWEIAEELFISENTVKFYMKSIFRKLGVSNRLGLKNEINNKKLP